MRGERGLGNVAPLARAASRGCWPRLGTFAPSPRLREGCGLVLGHLLGPLLNLVLSLGNKAWQEHGRPTRRPQQWVPTKRTALLSVFPEERPVSHSQTWLFPTKSVQCPRRLSLPATPLRSLLQGRLVTCPATSSGKKKKKKKKSPNNCSLVFKRSGGWGRWGGGEARWGLERSRVL